MATPQERAEQAALLAWLKTPSEIGQAEQDDDAMCGAICNRDIGCDLTKHS